MERAAILAVIAIALLLVPMASANTDLGKPILSIGTITDGETLCRVGVGGQTEYYYANNGNTCEALFGAQNDVVYRWGYLPHRITTPGTSLTANDAVPIIVSALHAVFSTGVVNTELELLRTPDSEEFPFVHGRVCGYQAQLRFTQRTSLVDAFNPGSPGTPNQNFMFWYDYGHDDGCPGNEQGYRLLSRGQNYALPLYCQDVRFEITNGQANDWSHAEGTWRLRTHGVFQGDIATIERDQSRNLFRITAQYDRASNRLDWYEFFMDDDSSSVGGYEFTAYCEGWIGPEDNLTVCESDAFSGTWRSTHEAGSQCCYQGMADQLAGSSYTDPTDNTGRYCAAEMGRWTWKEDIPVACVDGDPNSGQRFADDPASYCCNVQDPYTQYNEKPHLYSRTETTASGYRYPQSREYFCEAGQLQPQQASNSGDYGWAHDGERWQECTAEQDNRAHGDYLCTYDAEQQEGTWSACQKVDGQCCELGVYAVGESGESYPVNLADGSLVDVPLTAACINGFYISEKDSGTPNWPGLTQWEVS